jgi:hypothetical protein
MQVKSTPLVLSLLVTSQHPVIVQAEYKHIKLKTNQILNITSAVHYLQNEQLTNITVHSKITKNKTLSAFISLMLQTLPYAS